jgi:hypothetical protein
MAVTYEAIATQTLASAQTTVTFSGISQAYTDLVAVLNITSVGDNMLGRVGNGSVDSNNNYSYTRVSGNGSSATSARGSNSNYLVFDGAAYLNTTPAVYVIQYMNYSNSTTFKTILTRGNNASVGTDALALLWRSTAAIDTISFNSSSNQYATGSTFTLYGIKAA